MTKLSPKLVGFSKELRKAQTREEELLWSHLRANNLGYKFKRQVVVDNYIYDFGAKSKKLLIEIDGANHKKSRKNNDIAKIKSAKKNHYKVLKFWNSEIIQDLEKVLDTIYRNIN